MLDVIRNTFLIIFLWNTFELKKKNMPGTLLFKLIKILDLVILKVFYASVLRLEKFN